MFQSFSQKSITVPAALTLSAWLLTSLFNVYGADPLPYRRTINARDMQPVGEGWIYEARGSVRIRYEDDQAALEGGHLELRLEREMPPGRYLVIYRALSWNPADTAVALEFGFGDTTVEALTPKQRRTMLYAVEATVEEPWQTFRAAVRSGNVNVRFEYFYLSSEISDYTTSAHRGYAVVQDDFIFRELENALEDPLESPEPDNHFYDGGFELGIPTPFWSSQYQLIHVLGPDSTDDGEPAEGERSLRLYQPWQRFPVGQPRSLYNILSGVLKLKPNTTYHFRGMFRADQPANIMVNVVNAYENDLHPRMYRTPSEIGTASISADESWQTLNMTFETPDDIRGYFVTVAASAPAPGVSVWMDALTLTRDPIETFVPYAAVEVGVAWEPHGRVFHAGEAVAFTLSARNHAAGTADVAVRYRVKDYRENTVVDKTTAGWELAGKTLERRGLNLATGRTGAFRLLVDGVARIDGQTVAIPQQEYVYSVLPKPPDTMRRGFGAFINTSHVPIEIMSRAGIRQTVTLSCQNETLSHWRWIEPERGVYHWRDATVARVVRDAGTRIVFNLEIHGRSIPAWAKNPEDDGDVLMVGEEKFSRSAYENFVETLVGHYKGDIKHWLLVDEPYHYYSIDQYHELLRSTFQAVKRADPDARVLAHSGYYENWVGALDRVSDYFDGISGYARTPAQGSWMRHYRDEHDKFILAVEYGGHTTMYQGMETPLNPRYGRGTGVYRSNAEATVLGALRAMCWSGALGFNRYDARFPGGDFTQFDIHRCMFEYDGALKPAAVAYAVMSQLLDGMRGESDLTDRTADGGLHPQLEVLHLESSNRFALGVATPDGQLYRPLLSLPDGVDAYDIMGNKHERAHAIILSGSPVYLVGERVKLEATKTMLANLKLEPLVDFTARTVKTGPRQQFLLEVGILNHGERGLTGKVSMGAGRRNRWERPVPVEIGPGASAKVEFGLNAYGDFEPRRPTPSSISFTFDGYTVTREINNVFSLEKH